MKEVDVRTAVRHALMSRGYWPQRFTDGIKCFRCHATIVPPSKGRPDIFAIHPAGTSSVIEVKDVRSDKKENAVYFKTFSQDQRGWLDAWDEAAGDSGPGAFVAIGLILPAGSQTFLSAIWVVPWKDWKVIEENWKAYGESGVGIMPELYRRPPKVPRDLYMDQYPGFDALKIKRTREIDGRTGWQFPETHALTSGHHIQPRYKWAEKEAGNDGDTGNSIFSIRISELA